MSLQIGTGTNDYARYYTGYGPETAGANMQHKGQAASAGSVEKTTGVEKPGAVECQTCKNRKYVDGSDDPGVSFKAPAHVSPEGSAAAVMAHEQEHVSRDSSEAKASGRRVVSQSVQIYTDVCPECGRVYTSGGKTTTVTKGDSKPDYFMDKMAKAIGSHFGKYIDLKV